MKTINQLVFVVALACGSQLALAESAGSAGSRTADVQRLADVGGVGAIGGSEHTLVARPAGLCRVISKKWGSRRLRRFRRAAPSSTTKA